MLGGLPGMLDQRPHPLIEPRQRRQQAARVAAAVHHHHVVAQAGDHAEVVRDQHDRRAVVALQLAQQLRDLRLHGDVERGGRLVGDQQLGSQQQAPSRSSRAGACRRRTRADRSMRRFASGIAPRPAPRSRAARLAPRQAAVQLQHLGHLALDRQVRIERRHRILEDHAMRSPRTGSASRRQAQQVAAVVARSPVARPLRASSPSIASIVCSCPSPTRRRCPASALFQRRTHAVDRVDGRRRWCVKATPRSLPRAGGGVAMLSAPSGRARRAARRRQSWRSTA
jgi:hypothetical protein